MISGMTGAGRALGKMRDFASLAVSITKGKKLSLSSAKERQSYVITGFGYALMDVFENKIVDMEEIQQHKQTIHEVKSPFMSPSSSKKKKNLGGLSKEEYKKKRREEKRKEQEEKERKEREPPQQYSLIKIKTSVGKYPVMNYVPPFTGDEIQEGKKCLLNGWRRPPQIAPLPQPIKGKHANGAAFSL